MFGAAAMQPDELSHEFLPWYESMKNVKDWSFKAEMVKYCRADVEVLGKAVLKYRKMFKNLVDVDPFRYTSLPSLCMGVYKARFMPEDTIVANAAPKKDSRVAREWLTYLDKPTIKREWKIPITGFDEYEVKYLKAPKSGSKSYTVDGYDHTTNTIHQFSGCYWHGCRKCHKKFEKRCNKTLELSKLL